MCVGIPESADRGDSHAVKIRAGFRRIALKIPVQRAILLRDGKFIAGLCEVVHANIEIAGFEKFQHPRSKNLKFLHAFGQMRREGALLLLQPGHVGVAKQSDAIRRELQNLVDGMREAFRRLVWQAKNQIHINTVEAKLAGGLNEIARQFERLVAMNSLLYLGMKILDAHAEPVEAEPAECFEVRPGSHARVDLDADFGLFRKMEALASRAEEVLNLFGRQIGWSSSAPVKLNHGPFARHASAHAPHFLLEHAEIRRSNALILLNDDVARAEQAEALAERNVHVKRNRRARPFGLRMPFL